MTSLQNVLLPGMESSSSDPGVKRFLTNGVSCFVWGVPFSWPSTPAARLGHSHQLISLLRPNLVHCGNRQAVRSKTDSVRSAYYDYEGDPYDQPALTFSIMATLGRTSACVICDTTLHMLGCYSLVNLSPPRSYGRFRSLNVLRSYNGNILCQSAS